MAVDPGTAEGLKVAASLFGSVGGMGKAQAIPSRSEAGASYQVGGLTINKSPIDWTILGLGLGTVLVAAAWIKRKPKKKRKR